MSRIFLGGIPFKAVESDLEDLFSELGYAPTNVKILMEREDPQRSRGFGFCEISDDLAEQFIQDCNGQTIMGRTLHVNHATARQTPARDAAGRE